MTFERTITITVEADNPFEADEQAKMVANHVYSVLDIKAEALMEMEERVSRDWMEQKSDVELLDSQE